MSSGVQQDFTLDTTGAQREVRLLMFKVGEMEGALRKATDRAAVLERRMVDGPKRGSDAVSNLAAGLVKAAAGYITMSQAIEVVNAGMREQERLLDAGAAAARKMREETEQLARGGGSNLAARQRLAFETAARTGIAPERSAALLGSAQARGLSDQDFAAVAAGEQVAGGSGEALIDAVSRARALGASESGAGIIAALFEAAGRSGAAPGDLAAGVSRIMSAGGGAGLDLAESLGVAGLANRALGTEGVSKIGAYLKALEGTVTVGTGRTAREIPIGGAGLFGRMSALEADGALGEAFQRGLSPEAREGERLLAGNLAALRETVAALRDELRNPSAVSRARGVLLRDPAYAATTEENRSRARNELAALERSGARGSLRAALGEELGVLAQRSDENPFDFALRKAIGAVMQFGEFAIGAAEGRPDSYEAATARSFQFEAEALRNPAGAVGALFTHRPMGEPTYGAALGQLRRLDPQAQAVEMQARVAAEMHAAARELRRVSLNMPRVPTLATLGGKGEQ